MLFMFMYVVLITDSIPLCSVLVFMILIIPSFIHSSSGYLIAPAHRLLLISNFSHMKAKFLWIDSLKREDEMMENSLNRELHSWINVGVCVFVRCNLSFFGATFRFIDCMRFTGKNRLHAKLPTYTHAQVTSDRFNINHLIAIQVMINM